MALVYLMILLLCLPIIVQILGFLFYNLGNEKYIKRGKLLMKIGLTSLGFEILIGFALCSR